MFESPRAYQLLPDELVNPYLMGLLMIECSAEKRLISVKRLLKLNDLTTRSEHLLEKQVVYILVQIRIAAYPHETKRIGGPQRRMLGHGCLLQCSESLFPTEACSKNPAGIQGLMY